MVNGKADYKPKVSGMKPPEYHYVYLEVAPRKIGGEQGGVLKLNSGGNVTVDYYTNGKYVGPTKFSGEKAFLLANHIDNYYYCLVDKKDNHAEFYQGAEAAFSRSNFSIEIGESKASGKIPRIRTTQRQIDDKCVPYVELIMSGSNVTGFIWRFVSPSDPSVPLKKQKASDVSEVRRARIRGVDGKDIYDEALNLKFTDGNEMAGSVTLPSPVDVSKINDVRIFFDYGDNHEDNVYTGYAWRFLTKGRK
ncbi:hypothetical protein FACS1894204_10510 [Synergistales bacterium]|nr:hypothetical protein FACS1894204_10510 [Synergistales bacterium]